MEDDAYLPLSAVERFAFCPRQAYLFHAERTRADNRLTVEGSLLHARVVRPDAETRRGQHTARAVQLVSHRLGVRGVADVVEVHGGVPHPVEYKRGRSRGRLCEQAQLCLQALCLEEMLHVPVPAGSLYHARARRREEIVLGPELRAATERLVSGVRELLDRGQPPPAVLTRACRACSLVNVCLPRVTGGRSSAAAWLARRLGDAAQEER